MNYTGDLAPEYNFRTPRQSAYIFYRRNLDPAWSVKVSLLEGQINADDVNSNDPLPLARKASTGSTIVEFGITADYNFFNFRKEKDRRKFTPYLTGGLALFVYSQDSRIRQQISDGTSIAIPFGVGLKYKIGKQVNTGIEFVARKTFTDKLDGITSFKSPTGKELGDPYSRDWYYFTGITLSYIIFTVDCPTGYFR
jgi:hypothetical protein